ncbi:MAG TPA: TIGR04211 family SH3 domain-containing protein [Halieaceae bacterium]|nr:TIGR04211 family SH3 domain-containing protein [Halieaceae bacterium]
MHRGLPTGTLLSVLATSENQEFTQVTTANGTEGWIRTQYLTDTPPARLTLAAMQGSEAEMRERLQTLQQQLSKSQAEVASAVAALSDSEQALADLNERYTELERLSGNSVELDKTNRSLLQSVETLSAEQETLQAENQRLLERMEYSQFTDGALAVGLGVIITLLIPRLWPQRKRNSGWS